MSSENKGIFPLLNKVSAKVAFSPSCNLQCVYCGGSKDRIHSATPGLMEDYRAESVSTGMISTDKLLRVLNGLHESGIKSIRPTGGEPMLRKDWDKVVDAAAEMGFRGVDITTNGVLLPSYLERNGKLPKGLTTVKVSLDTDDPDKFEYITGGGDLKRVIEGIRAIASQVYVRANKVFLRSEATADNLKRFIYFCIGLGMKQIMYLDLVHYPNSPNNNPEFWKKEFAGYDVFLKLIKKAFPGIEFQENTDQFGVDFHQAIIRGTNGFLVSFKDSQRTMRDEQCWSCPAFCQEGRVLLRVATDGNVTFCPDYKAEMPHFNGVNALDRTTFTNEMTVIDAIVGDSRKFDTINTFKKKHNLGL